MELPIQDDATTALAIATLWDMPQLTGCYKRNDIDSMEQIALDRAKLPIDGHVYGVATLFDGHSCVCGSFTIDLGLEGRWVVLYIPLGALDKIYPIGGYPFGYTTPQLAQMLWNLNEWFRALAAGVYQRVAFNFGIIGFEADIVAVKSQVREAAPPKRWNGVLIPNGDGLEWYPPTEYDPQFT